MADTLGIDHRFAAGCGGDGLLLGPHALFPGVGDPGVQVQAVDAGMVGFQVGPEHAQAAAELLQAGVVDRWLAFPQVVDEQVTDRQAGEVVTVDHFLRRALARGAQLAQPRRRCRAEDPHLAQQPVAGGAVASGRAVHAGLGVEQLQEITDGDAGERAARGGQDDRGPAQCATARRLRYGGITVTQGPQLRETVRVAQRGHAAGQLAVIAFACCQPSQGRAHDVGADGCDQGRDQRRCRRDRVPGPLVQPVPCQLPPRGCGSIGAAGQPALLPAAAVLALQPVQ